MEPAIPTSPVYDAARQFESAALRADDSLFTPGASIWARGSIDDLYERFVLKPDNSKDTFENKFRRQLAGAPSDTIQLAAEALFVTLLGPSDVGAKSKQRSIETVLSWSPDPASLPARLLPALNGGIGGYGIAIMHRPFQLWMLVEFVRKWKSLPTSEREQALADPWKLKQELLSVKVRYGATQREALLNLLRPDVFEPIIARSHKQAIVAAFRQYARNSRSDIDDQLLQVRAGLTPTQGVGFSFYGTELQKQWHPKATAGGGTNGNGEQLRDAIAQTLKSYCEARHSAQFAGSHPVFASFQRVVQLLQASDAVKRNTHLAVRFSLGQGNWAKIPWIAILDNRVTTTTQTGFYCVFLYREDCHGLYLTFNQGVTQPQKDMGTRDGKAWLRDRATDLRSALPQLASRGFKLDGAIDLHSSGALGADYEVSTVAHKYYPADDMPLSAELLEDVDALLTAYDSVIQTEDEDLPSLADVHAEFAARLRGAGLIFGSSHDQVVRRFLASVMTKRFVILTGLSGSGKTQIALKFGEWVGEDRCLVLPVRPDWTGPEPLFGYEDVLRPPTSDGRRAWTVPPALEFMLRAAADAENPYVLILDEMNLAHVERYFADYLSGIESRQRVLPNLVIDESGDYRVDSADPEPLEIPVNLFVLGTVNVDETTYLFSPKVLDRANSIEFRVTTDDLAENVRKPDPLLPGAERLVKLLLGVATDDEWHLKNAFADASPFTEALRRLHRVLSRYNAEFGHRTYYEALRFSAIYGALGDPDADDVLDVQLYQKVLPRIHGSRRKVEPLLQALGAFCVQPDGLDSEASPPKEFDVLTVDSSRLPLALDKIRRIR